MKKLNKNSIICLVVIIILLAVLVLLIIDPFKGNKDSDSNKYDLNGELIKVGKEYYDKTFYPTVSSNINFLNNYSNTGLSLTLDSVSIVVKLNEELEKNLKEKNCDYSKTKILIYPKDPFGEKDYDVKVELSCQK